MTSVSARGTEDAHPGRMSPAPAAPRAETPSTEQQSSVLGSLGAKGFRPFFLSAAGFAALIVPIWLLTLSGAVTPSRYMDPVTWHAHEMIFGFTVAVIAGFMLTAVASWTGKETVVGPALLACCLLWCAGRAAMALAGELPRGVPALVDLAFLPVLAAAIARPLAATRNKRNFVMVAILAALWLADLAIHLDALGIVADVRRRATVFALDVVVLLMVVIAGRVVPMFTKNATQSASVRSLPGLDKAAIVAMAATALVDVSSNDPRLGGVAAAIAAVLIASRAATWGAAHTARHPLLWILHAGHAWIVVGLLLRTLASLTTVVSMSAANHALTVGAIGALTLGMMARVSLGHTGRLLAASKPMTVAFGFLSIAALVRVFVPIVDMSAYRGSLHASGALWTASFVIFAIVYAPILMAPRPDGKAG